ncbi:hypothetical protein ACFLSQ_11780, partial [Bacteroidota bacterium]
IIPSPAPDEILATNPGPHCPGSSNTYTVAPVSGATSYSWFLETEDPGWSSTFSTTTDFIVSSGTLTIGPATIYAAANNICGSSATISRTLSPFASPDGITASPPGGHCVNSTKTYSTEPIEHATAYGWHFDGGTEWSASSSSTTSIEVTSGTMTLSSATLSVWAINDCGTSLTFTKLIDPVYSPSSPGSIEKPLMHCSGTSATYGVDPVAGALYYAWDVNNGSWSATGTDNVISITAGTGSATISVSAVNDCGISFPTSTDVEAWITPSTPTITLPSSHCSEAAATYTVNSDIYASDYTWIVEGIGWSGSSTTTEITVTSSTTSGTISVIANGVCGSSSTVTTIVNPLFIPEKPDRIYTPPYHCEGEIKTYACTPVQGATSYSWYISGTEWSGTSSTNYIDLKAGSVMAKISVTANTSCGSSDSISIYFSPLKTPGAPAGISGPGLHCTGTVKIYSVAPVQGSNEYTWLLSNTPGATTPWTLEVLSSRDVNMTAGSHSATITVLAANKCGDGMPYSTILVPDHTPLQPGAISAPNNHCEGSAQQYSISTVSDADTYSWGVSGPGWNVTPSNTTECDIIAGSGPGTISVRAVNDCGAGVARTLNVNPDRLPATPGSIIKPAIHCEGSVEEYSVAPVTGATSYVWDVSGNFWSGSSTEETINITSGVGEATITARAVNSCGQGPAASTSSTAIPLPTSEFSIDRDTVCRDEIVTVVYTGDAGSGASFNWNFDEGTADPGIGKGPHSVMWFDNPGI